MVMMRGMPGGRHDAVGSPVGLPRAALARFVANVLAYAGVSGGFWPRPGGTPGTQPIPPWLIQIPARSRRLLGWYACMPQAGSEGWVFAAASNVLGSVDGSRYGA